MRRLLTVMLGKGRVAPENTVLTRQKDFSYRLVMSNRISIILNTKPFMLS